MARRTRLAGVAAALAASTAVLIAPMAMAQADSSMLAVRGIDATDRENVQLTFLYTGQPQDMEELTIREDGELKEIKELTNLRKTDQGLATVYVVDLSSSMVEGSTLANVKEGLTAAVQDIPAGDEVAIVSFSDTALVETDFTDNVDQLTGAIDEMAAPSDGKAAMWDGVREAAGLFAEREELQPNVVLITDSTNDVPSSTAEAAQAALVTSGAALYTLELTHVDEVDSAAFEPIMARTGGAAFAAGDAEAIAKAFDAIDATAESQYVASYESKVDQGQVDVSVAVGSLERGASYVAGASAQGAATSAAIKPDKPFGPDWLRGSAAAALGLVLVGLAFGLGTYAVVGLVTRSDESLNAVLRPYSEGPLPTDVDEGALAQTAILQRAVELTEEFAERQGFLVKVERALERADLPLRAAEALFFYGVGAVLLTVLSFALGGFMMGLVIMFLAVLLPPAAVNFMAARRSKAFQGQLPDTLQLLSGSLRAGYSLLQGVEAVSKEVGEPMGKELRRVITEARLGREVEDALDAVSERMGSADFAWAVMAIRIQREVGGNLSELLLTVSDTMVHRDRLRRDIAALTAEGKMSAIILGLLPIGLGAFMWLSNPTYMAPLGSTGLGKALLCAAAVSGLAGFAWMKKIINIEI